MTENTTPPSRPSIEEIKKKHALRSYLELSERRRELGTSDFVVAGLLPARSMESLWEILVWASHLCSTLSLCALPLVCRSSTCRLPVATC